MTNYIATWIYLESEEEKSKYPNNKGDASSKVFQEVYWKCVIIFYETSLRYNTGAKHILFTNTKDLPIINGFDIAQFLKENAIDLVCLENKYPLPTDYFDRFRNQFFEFSIIKYMSTITKDEDGFLLLDSDCIFSKSAAPLFTLLEKEESAITYVVDLERDYQVHGVTGNDMKAICNAWGLQLKENPYYCGGEVLLARGTFLKNVAAHFPKLFRDMLERSKKGLPKFNEEAHTLTYYYYKHKANMNGLKPFVQRLWTNRNYFRNVEENSKNLIIWHLPNEKNTGFARLFEQHTILRLSKMEEGAYQELIQLELLRKENYLIDWYKKFKNRAYKLSMALGLKTR
jgi:hypothetical protein